MTAILCDRRQEGAGNDIETSIPARDDTRQSRDRVGFCAAHLMCAAVGYRSEDSIHIIGAMLRDISLPSTVKRLDIACCSCRPRLSPGQALQPNLNPIEQVLSTTLDKGFAKLKHLMRKAAERSYEATWRRVGILLDTFTADKCGNYLVNSGYGST